MNQEMAHIVFPTSVTGQGRAFEDLILSYYQRSDSYRIDAWSGYYHGASGTWWQCDGIVEAAAGRYLVEAKFFPDRPATVRDIDPNRRQAAARDMNCDGIWYISLSGFSPEMLGWSHRSDLTVNYLTWPDLRSDLLAGIPAYSSVLLDAFDLHPTHAIGASTSAALYYDTLAPAPLSTAYPEFVVVPDKLELWLRRLPALSIQRDQTNAGRFYYDQASEQVSLVPDRASDLSLQEAWAIQDALSGYASRTYNAVRATAEALARLSDGLLTDIQGELHRMGWKTGPDGVRSSLDFLVSLGLIRKWPDPRKTRYELTPFGRAYTAGGQADDTFFASVLKSWLPYRAVCQAIDRRGVPPTADGLLTYFKAQYAPYEPYARSLFNPNKADGLTRLYTLFGR